VRNLRRTRTSARGRHGHLLLRNIVGPVTRLHFGQARDSGSGSDDGSAASTMEARRWRWMVEGCFLGRRVGEATTLLELRRISYSCGGALQAGNPANLPFMDAPLFLLASTANVDANSSQDT
jgi:hypothetical protein